MLARRGLPSELLYDTYTDVPVTIKQRVNIPLSPAVKRQAESLARKQHISLSRFLQETVELRLKQEARRDLDRRLEEAGREMAEEDRREAKAWEAADFEADRFA